MDKKLSTVHSSLHRAGTCAVLRRHHGCPGDGTTVTDHGGTATGFRTSEAYVPLSGD